MRGTFNMFRVVRVTNALRETRDARGWFPAMVFLARMLISKGPMLLRQAGAKRKSGKVRENVARLRADMMPDVPYLAFVLTGGIGDYIVIARFIRDLGAHIGAMKFDTFSPNPTLAAWAFARIPGFNAAYYDIAFDHVIREYDVGMRLNQFAIVYDEHIRWTSVRRSNGLTKVIDNLMRYRPKIEVFVERHPYMDNYLARAAVFGNATRQDYLHKIAGLSYGGARLPLAQEPNVLSRMGLHQRQYVTIHNGFDTGFVINGHRATKCYPHFGAVVARLKRSFPDLQFIQVGTVTSELIQECDQVLLNKTSLDEVVSLLANAVLHIDNEGGLVHLAACLGTRSVVVFGPTPSDYFGYPNNVNIDPPVCGNCWWMTQTWMDLCPKRYETARCMTEQSPEVVADQAIRALAGALPNRSEGMREAAVVTSLNAAPKHGAAMSGRRAASAQAHD